MKKVLAVRAHRSRNLTRRVLEALESAVILHLHPPAIPQDHGVPDKDYKQALVWVQQQLTKRTQSE